MGFYINEITYELKQHLNLSDGAWETVYNDMNSFYGETGRQSFSGFLNRVFHNFYQDAEGSVKLRGRRLADELKGLMKRDGDIARDETLTEKTVAILVDEYEKRALEKATSYPKGIGKKFRVNRQNLDVLRDLDCSELYGDSIGAYIKAVIEEYTTLPQARREAIFFKDTIDACSFAIAKRNKLKITLSSRYSSRRQESYTRRFYVSPYAVLTDKNGFFNYLIGISEEILRDGALGEKTVSSFRISRIEKIAVMSSMSAFLSSRKVDEIENELKTKSPQYMAGELWDIEVLFTDKGLELFDRQLYLRPAVYTSIDKHRYVFHCTEMQAIHYFFKFGRDAQIVAPASLRDKFISYYRSALSAYENE